jgi:hypothetical protein
MGFTVVADGLRPEDASRCARWGRRFRRDLTA